MTGLGGMGIGAWGEGSKLVMGEGERHIFRKVEEVKLVPFIAVNPSSSTSS